MNFSVDLILYIICYNFTITDALLACGDLL